MTYAVFSDVHSNQEALRSVLKDLKKRRIHDVFFIGDSVGYGPEPNECIEILKDESKVLLAGNHDWGVCGLTDISFFNQYARAAIEWTQKVISQENIRDLGTLSVISKLENEDITLVHSTPYEPEQWHYIFTLSDAEFNFQHFETKLCFVGHSHQPFIIEKLPSGELLTEGVISSIKPESRYIINVGSIGQPRDGDPRASYAVIDDEKVEIVRVVYDIGATQKKMVSEGLPLPLIQRLSFGM